MSLFLIHFTGNRLNSSADDLSADGRPTVEPLSRLMSGSSTPVGDAAKTLAQSLTALTALQTLQLCGNDD